VLLVLLLSGARQVRCAINTSAEKGEVRAALEEKEPAPKTGPRSEVPREGPQRGPENT
jgi:hypothetical protein